MENFILSAVLNAYPRTNFVEISLPHVLVNVFGAE